MEEQLPEQTKQAGIKDIETLPEAQKIIKIRTLKQCQPYIKPTTMRKQGRQPPFIDECQSNIQQDYRIIWNNISRFQNRKQSKSSSLHKESTNNNDIIADCTLTENDFQTILKEVRCKKIPLQKIAEKWEINRYHLSLFLKEYSIANVITFVNIQYGGYKKVDEIEEEIQDDSILHNSCRNLPIYVVIMFPKIKFGQVYQWERFYSKLYREVRIFNIQWVGFYKGRQINGRGCEIILKCYIWYPQVFHSFKFVEQYLLQFIPGFFFSINGTSKSRLRVFSQYSSVLPMIENETLHVYEGIQEKRRKQKKLSDSELNELNEFEKKLHESNVGLNVQVLFKEENIFPSEESNSPLQYDQPIQIDAIQNLERKDNQIELNKYDLQMEGRFMKSEYFDYFGNDENLPKQDDTLEYFLNEMTPKTEELQYFEFDENEYINTQQLSNEEGNQQNYFQKKDQNTSSDSFNQYLENDWLLMLKNDMDMEY